MIIKYICPNEIKYETSNASGVDLRSIEDGTVPAKGTGFFNTGLKVSIPVGYEGQVRGRSGLAKNKGIGITHGIGTIDADYRDWETDRKSTRLNSSHSGESRMPSSA